MKTPADMYVADAVQLALADTILRFVENPGRYVDRRDAQFQIYSALRRRFPAGVVVWGESASLPESGFDIGVAGPCLPGTVANDNCHFRVGIKVVEQGERNSIAASILKLSEYRNYRLSYDGLFLGCVVAFAMDDSPSFGDEDFLEEGGVVLHDGIALHIFSLHPPCWRSGEIDSARAPLFWR